MMRRVHPLWRGFWLAAALVTVRLLTGGPDGLAAYRLDRRILALSFAVTAGAFLAALPGRLRKGRRMPGKPALSRCIRALIAGAAMALGLHMAGGGRILPALMEGSAGAYAFAGTAWLTGLLTVRIAGRRLQG